MVLIDETYTHTCPVTEQGEEGMVAMPNQVPRSFLCPISMDIMDDPVVILGSMQTISRGAARQWFYLGNSRCPVTNVELETCKTIPNRSLAAAIREWKTSSGKSIEKSFVCPMTGEEIKDPVLMVGSMQTLSKLAAEQWIASGNSRCPITNVVLKNKSIIPNFALRGALDEWKETYQPLTNKSSGNKQLEGGVQADAYKMPSIGFNDQIARWHFARGQKRSLSGCDGIGISFLCHLFFQYFIALHIGRQGHSLLTWCNNTLQASRFVNKDEIFISSDTPLHTKDEEAKKCAVLGSCSTSHSDHVCRFDKGLTNHNGLATQNVGRLLFCLLFSACL